MKRTLLTAACFFFLLLSYAQDYNEQYGTPVIVLFETTPGSDVPSFALYDNGQIIYKKTDKYFEVKGTTEKTQAFIRSLGITDSLIRLPDYIQAAEASNQPTSILTLNIDTFKQIRVYGNLREANNEARSKTPKSFLYVYDNLIRFDSKNAHEWLPDHIEVIANEEPNAPEKPAVWNSAWGDINSATTVKRGDNLYGIFIDKKYFPDFLKLIGSLKEKQAVEINGKQYALSYRLPFPNIR